MNTPYWRTDGQEPWKWDETGKIRVYGLSEVSDSEIEKLIKITTEVINEFSLPLSVEKGNTHQKDELEQYVKQCSDENEIDFELLEEEVNRQRRENKFLPCGLIIIVNDSYSFKERLNERAFYGNGSYEGLIVIKREYVNIATKHEFGHMIGLGDHHENCVMVYSCNNDKFCEKCQNQIKKMWEIE